MPKPSGWLRRRDQLLRTPDVLDLKRLPSLHHGKGIVMRNRPSSTSSSKARMCFELLHVVHEQIDSGNHPFGSHAP
jgi:hypothetical protein